MREDPDYIASDQYELLGEFLRSADKSAMSAENAGDFRVAASGLLIAHG